jgi:hypothetical protein
VDSPTVGRVGRRRTHANDSLGALESMFILWILAVILVIAGIFQLFKGEVLWGIVLIIVGFAVGPGGYSIFS